MRTSRGFASAARLASVCAAVILISGLVHWDGVRLSWAAPFKSVQVRPSPPRFVPRVEPRLKEHVDGNKTLNAYVLGTRTWSTREALGHDPWAAPDAKRKPLQLPEGSELRWFQLEITPKAPKVPTPIAKSYPELRQWYAPAADLASQRSFAGLFADEVRMDFKAVVGGIEVADVMQWGTAATVATQHSAEQLAIRLLAAAFEEEHLALASRVSEDAVNRRLVHALRGADTLGSRPIGNRVWGDLLAAEFPPSIYLPKVQVSEVDAAGIVDYRVDSWLLPTTQTKVGVAAYAKKEVEEHRRLLKMFPSLRDSSPPK